MGMNGGRVGVFLLGWGVMVEEEGEDAERTRRTRGGFLTFPNGRPGALRFSVRVATSEIVLIYYLIFKTFELTTQKIIRKP